MYKGTLGQALFKANLPKGFQPSGNFGPKEIKSNLENEPGFSVDDINAEIEEMRKVGY